MYINKALQWDLYIFYYISNIEKKKQIIYIQFQNTDNKMLIKDFF